MDASVLVFVLTTVLLTLNFMAAFALGVLMATFLLKALLGYNSDSNQTPCHGSRTSNRLGE